MTEKSTSPTTNGSTSATGTADEKSPRKENISDSLKSRTFRIPSHCDMTFQTLNKQRSSGEFCDITVLVEHQRFSAHKCILAANSPYFRNLLATDNDGIFLRNITAESFSAILDFMYSSRLHLSPTSVQNVLTAAKFLQIKGVVSICCRYLESQLRFLSRDIDDFKNIKHNRPIVVATDASDLHRRVGLPSLSPLQQQPQLSYNATTGNYQSNLPNNCHFKPIIMGAADQNPAAFILPNQQQLRSHGLAHQQPAMSLPHHVPNSFTNPAAQSYAIKSSNLNPSKTSQEMPNLIPNADYRNSFVPSMNQRPPGYPAQHASHHAVPHQHHGMTPGMTQMVSNPNAKPHHTYISKHDQFPPAMNPFVTVPHHNQMIPVQGKSSGPGGNRYSQSTGGKGGRRHYVPARRKGGQGTVSAGSPFKFTFGDQKLFPSVSTPCDKKEETDDPESCSEGQIMMFSSAKENKRGKEPKKKSSSPDTVFDVEAEDRYWDALSTKVQTTR